MLQRAYEKIKLIQERIKAVHSRQKSYVDTHRRALEFDKRDKVFLKIAPMKGIMKFKKKDPSHIISYETLEIGETLSYEEIPIQVLDYKEQELRIKKIPLVKVLWRNHAMEEASGELEEEMRQKYPHLFSGIQQ
ncbi:uncharacterized protein LOC131163469 [Malania oleifera]|uniref:uncharacterized protein LOC131163469 n=1 Tax=Malania oleifera TaxID=397392 RepID=UPI0025ADCD90|nr:uncharacterized protein LOC131163469 [Malania oleifera]